MQLDKKLSAEKELILDKIKALEEKKVSLSERLESAKEASNATPWDAERYHYVEELEHQLSVVEFNLETLKKKL